MSTNSDTTPVAPDPNPSSKTDEQPLPKLTPAEFRQYNRMADLMNAYHNHFRQTWTTLYDAARTNRRPARMTARQYIALGEQFAQGLTFHHTYEERNIFPVLAKRMPAFRQELELLTQHHQIHEGLVGFEDYLRDCRTGVRDLRLAEVKERLDVFGGVLWAHLDDEVRQLGAENMRRFWTLREMEGLPF